MGNSVLERVLASPWGEAEPVLRALRRSAYRELFCAEYARLDRTVLYESWVHGPGHVERVMLLAALLAMEEGFSARDTELLLLAAAYHDAGRADDTRDPAHGRRSAEMLALDSRLAPRLKGLSGEERRALLGAVEAHSLSDPTREDVGARWDVDAGPDSLFRLLAVGLKDADNLDRVRLGDMDPKHLRTPAAKELTDFAAELFRRYMAETENR